ncbi:DUF421 domain-containing protein [Pontibacter beigongshangensis]|uniref:DUF421 domain-containing protein n=1 Tax=Pontibacter beigongshangensis TaxID=2574733 RepID=UPI0016509F44|nr:YetF domain-containing protein [Pontibacter beigongshangensis]
MELIILSLDLKELFRVEVSVLELIIKGAVIYLGILLLIRLLPRRTGGELAIMDLIFVLLIAEAATHSLGGFSTITEGFIVIGTLMLCNYLVNVLSFYSPLVEKFVSAPPLQIIKDGKLLRRNMRREYLTEAELMDHLRIEGIEDINDIKSAYVEGDGKISFIPKKTNR